MSTIDLAYFAGSVITLIGVAVLYAIGGFGWPSIIGLTIGAVITAWLDHRKWKREQRS